MSLAFAIFICIPFGIGLGMAVCSITLAAVERRHKRHILQLRQEILQPRQQAASTIEIEALGRLTDLIVLNGECALCGSDHLGLLAAPYHPAHHQQHPCCPVPYSRKLYLERSPHVCAVSSTDHRNDLPTGRKLLPGLPGLPQR